MAIQPIRLFGDPVLRVPAEPVRDFDRELRTLVRDLTDTIVDAPGVGPAAPQLGVGLRVFAYHVDGELGHLVNPDLDLSEEEQEDDEGCLSFPGLAFPCRRALRVVARGMNMYGDPVTIEGSDLLARCVQHETDHLNGIPSSTASTASNASSRSRPSAKPSGRACPCRWSGIPARNVRQGALISPGAPGLCRDAAGGRALLDALLASQHDVVAVLTRPDAPAGRGRRTAREPGRDTCGRC